MKQGAKLQYGNVPLYESGDDPSARTFASLHGVQRHMVDTGRCKMAYDDNEEEYEDFYDYSGAGGWARVYHHHRRHCFLGGCLFLGTLGVPGEHLHPVRTHT